MTDAVQGRLQTDLQRRLATMLARDVADPRLQGIHITRIDFSGRHRAIVWIHALDVQDPAFCVQQLMRMRAHFEHALRRVMPGRRIPALQFRWDHALDRSHAVLDRLRQLRR